ncbi:MAG: Dienelactone hydrolase [Massilia sp.]|nr:Dienelactone hydrolase [Massilia sp.]
MHYFAPQCLLSRLFMTIALITAVPLAGAADLTLTPAAGPHAVGLRVIAQADASRVTLAEPDAFGNSRHPERARPMQTLVWYPAAAAGTQVQYLDYMKTALTENDAARPAAELAREGASLLTGNAAARARLQHSMLATRDAAPAAGSYPVIIYAPSFAAPAHENADLCEYLASHGYIVLASASRGPRTAVMTDDLEGVEAQATDIAWLSGFAATVPGADLRQVAVVGFSWGGLANVFAAARSARIKALVSLDGSVRSYPQLIAAATYVTPASVAVPMLSIGSAPQSIERLNEREKSTASSFLNSMKFSDVYLATNMWMEHMHFAGRTLRIQSDDGFKDYSRDELALASTWNARYVRAFLDAYLKHDAPAKAFLGNGPVANGVPKHMMAMTVRPAKAVVPSESAFLEQFNRRRQQDAVPIFEAMRKDQPGFTLTPIQLNNWGYELLRAKPSQPRGAIELFKLAIFIEPKWGDVHDSLGEAYEAAGEKTLAIAAYQQALALDPSQANSAQRLKVLRAQ